MDTQPKLRATAHRTERNAAILSGLLADSEPVLRRQARRHTLVGFDADDALQSAYALFIERYRGDCDPLAWLQTTVKREAWAVRRKHSREREMSLNASADSKEAWVESIPGDSPEPCKVAIAREEILDLRRQVESAKA